ncbi:MAG: hypothetical protein AAF591_12825 [Verrucomicrobiota bacterium]
MFQRLNLESWHGIIPVIAFILTFGVFIYFVVRAVTMKKKDVNHISRLPLDDDSDHTNDNS